MKFIKILGKEGRTTIPYGLRLKLGFHSRDVIIFEETDDKNVILIRKVPYCNSCKAYAKETKENETLQEFLGMLTPQQKLNAYRFLRGELTVMGGLSYAEG